MQVNDETEKGIRYREIIDTSYLLIENFKSYYEWMGKRVWVNPIGCEKWMLTVELGVSDETN